MQGAPAKSTTNTDASSSGPALNLWIVNQYAQPDGAPGISRHSTLARLMRPHGISTTIVAGDRHYWSGRVSGDRRPVASDSARRITVWTPQAESNGAKRVLSMLAFSVMAIGKGWRRRSGCGPDVVIGSSPHPFGAVAAWALAKRHHARFVLEIRDIWPKSLVNMLGTPKWHPFIVLLGAVERFLYARADVIVTLLPGSDTHIRAVCPRSADIHWIPNGVEFEQGRGPAPREQNGEFVAMYAGAHGLPNSLDTLVKAAGIAARRDREMERHAPRIRVVLVGDGKEKSNLVRMAADLGLDNVSFLDSVPKAEVPALLASADVLVLTLLDSPVFRDGISPNKLFDYMAAGRPVIMSVDTPVDPVKTARAGVTVQPANAEALADAMLNMRDTPIAERDAMGRRGREYVEANHDMRALAARLAGVVRDVVRP